MNPGRLLLESLWIAAPLVLAGAVHIAIIKLGLFRSLAQIPLDARCTFRSHRVFGDNKSVRGAIVTVAAAIFFTIFQAALVSHFNWARAVSTPEFQAVSPVAWGLLLGVGYVAGELPNSFIKRQLGIAPGNAARGGWSALSWLVDQVDSLAGVLVCLALVWRPPLAAIAILVAITLVIHPAMALAMCMLGLKRRIG